MKIRLIILSFLAFLISFGTSCNVSPQEETALPEPALAVGVGNNAWACATVGEAFTFNLETVTSGQTGGAGIPAGMSYHVFLAGTPPYQLGKNCMCKIQHYTLEFSNLPQGSLPVVEDLNGNSIPFTGPFATASGLEAITIHKKYLNYGLYVGFDGGLSPQPELMLAGGFCIVDNISAPYEPGVVDYVSAYMEVAFDTETQTEYLEYFLPPSVLTAVGP